MCVETVNPLHDLSRSISKSYGFLKRFDLLFASAIRRGYENSSRRNGRSSITFRRRVAKYQSTVRSSPCVIEVALRRGEIFLHLPDAGLYHTSAKCDLGAVNSDYAGQEKPLRWRVGHRIETSDPKAPHKLNLNVKYGDIVILKTRLPKPPESKLNGL
jgi:hypothetical protein